LNRLCFTFAVDKCNWLFWSAHARITDAWCVEASSGAPKKDAAPPSSIPYYDLFGDELQPLRDKQRQTLLNAAPAPTAHTRPQSPARAASG